MDETTSPCRTCPGRDGCTVPCEKLRVFLPQLPHDRRLRFWDDLDWMSAGATVRRCFADPVTQREQCVRVLAAAGFSVRAISNLTMEPLSRDVVETMVPPED